MSNLGQTLLIPAKGFGSLSASLSPDAVAGMKLWLKADAITGKTDGQAIAQWDDSSGNGYHATQVTGSRQPLYKTNIINGKPVVRFDGTDTLSTASVAFGSPTGITVYAVASAASGTAGRIVEASINFDAAASNAFVLRRLASFPFAGNRGDVGRSFYQVNEPITAAAAAMLMSAVYDTTLASNEARAWGKGHGNSNVITDQNNTSAFADNVLWIASQAQSGDFLTGDIAELIVYAGAHSYLTRLRIERHLQNKYGLAPYVANIALDGDSLTYGTGATNGTNYPRMLTDLLTDAVTLTNYSAAGQRMDQMAADAATQIDGAFASTIAKNICIVWGGTNDLFASQTAASTYTELFDYCTARRTAGWKVVVVTCLPRTAVGTPVGFEAARGTFNTNIQTNWATFADAIADIAANTNIGDATDSDDLTYYAADKVHLNDTGYAIVAGIIETALGTIGVT